jgi:hypothetical protein
MNSKQVLEKIQKENVSFIYFWFVDIFGELHSMGMPNYALFENDFDHFFEKMMIEKVVELINYACEPKYLLYGIDWPISANSYLNFIAKLKIKQECRSFNVRKCKKLFKIS